MLHTLKNVLTISRAIQRLWVFFLLNCRAQSNLCSLLDNRRSSGVGIALKLRRADSSRFSKPLSQIYLIRDSKAKNRGTFCPALKYFRSCRTRKYYD